MAIPSAAPQFDPISNTVGKPGAKFYKHPPRPPVITAPIMEESDWNAADEYIQNRITKPVGESGARVYMQPPAPPAPYGTINKESDWNAADEFLNKMRNERSDLFK